LGNGNNLNQNSPVQIGTENTWWKIVAGHYSTVALKLNGTLWEWGNNGWGQPGNGTTIDKNIPGQTGTNNDWSQIAAGRGHVLAVKTGGTLWTWGYNVHGQLGDSTATDKYLPQQIGTATNWKLVSAGEYHSLALKTDDTIFAWGYNVYGQVGLEDYRDQLTPEALDCPADYCSVNTWTGAVDTAWENTANWSCASLPGDSSVVYINSGLSNYPVVNSFARCKKIVVFSGALLTINPGFKPEIKGLD